MEYVVRLRFIFASVVILMLDKAAKFPSFKKGSELM